MSEDTVTGLRAVVVIDDMQNNPYFAAQASDLFTEVTYLPQRPDPAGVQRALEDFDVVIIGAREKITSESLSDRTRAQIVGTLSIGTDHLDLDALRSRDIEVINSPTANIRSVAEHNVALAFALAKRLKEGDQAISAGSGRAGLRGSASELHAKTAGLIGYGKIGKATAQIFAALGVKVLATSRSRTQGSDGNADFVPLDDVLEGSDIVVLAVPLTDDTRKLLDAEALSGLRSGAILINTCRPGIVDNQRVHDLLADGRLGGYGADFDEDVCGLAALPNAVVTPHIAGLTAEASDRLDNELIDRIRAFLDNAGT